MIDRNNRKQVATNTYGYSLPDENSYQELSKKERGVISMKRKELDQSQNKLRALLWMVMAACLTLSGCARFGPIALNKAVINYDDTVLQSEQQVLLLNIIRMHDDQPPHFTIANNIAATFTLTHTGTLNPMVSRSHGGTSAISVSALAVTKTVTDSPTITISPMQGKDYAQRLLAPIDPAFVNTLFMQRSAPRLDKMLRLMGKNFYMMGPEKAKAVFESIPLKDSEGKIVKYQYPIYNLNDLKDKGGFGKEEADCLLDSVNDCYMENHPWKIREGRKGEDSPDVYKYRLFRKVVSHIQALALLDRLYFFSLDFYVPKEGTFRKKNPNPNQNPKQDTIVDTVGALEKNYHWQEMTEEATQEKKGLILTKRYPITAITDFDFDEMGYRMGYKAKKMLLKKIQEDLELNGEIALGENMIVVLLRGNTKNDGWPIYGYFTLRNFRVVLQFLAESLIKGQPGYASEYDVEPSQFTKELLVKEGIKLERLHNPALTLTINSSDPGMKPPPPRDRLIDVEYNGKLFWISSAWGHPSRWDREVFSMLYEMYQFNNIAPVVPPPAVSIAK